MDNPIPPISSLESSGIFEKIFWKVQMRRRVSFARFPEPDKQLLQSAAEERLPRPGFDRQVPREVVPGLPQPATSRRQNSERRERLGPVTPWQAERKTVSVDRQRALSARPASPVPIDNLRLSAPEIREIEDEFSTIKGPEAWPEVVEDRSEEPVPFPPSPASPPPPAPPPDLGTDRGEPTGSEGSQDDDIDKEIREELESKLILNLSMHFRDQTPCEKFFITYVQTPQWWRRVTITCDYRGAPPDSLERDLQSLRFQRDKSARIYESIRASLPDIRFYDTVTNLKLETRNGGLHVYVTEDINEITPYPTVPAVQPSDLCAIDFINQFDKPPLASARKNIVPASWVTRLDEGIKTLSNQKIRRGLRGLVNGLSDLSTYEAIMTYRSAPVSATAETLKLEGSPAIFKLGNYQKIRRGLRGLVNGFKVSAVADTGADRNVVTAAFAKQRSLKLEGSPAIFKLGNSKFVQSLGVVRMMWSFAENPREKVEVLCDVLSEGMYDVILGCGFLKATKTMSKHRYRLTKCFFPSTNFLGMNFLGGGTQRLKGIVGSYHQTLAVPDSGADRNVMDLGYAQSHGFDIQTQPENCGYLQFADGSFQQTVGQVTTTWTFENGECIPVTFEILQHCCSDVILGDDILWENDVFGRHSSSLVEAASSDETFGLAPFGYLRKWQKKMDSLFHKKPTPESNPLNNSQRIEAGERRRRDRWNFQYGFGGHKASPAEQEAEKQRRIRYRNNGRIPRIPSIPTSADLMEGLSNNGI